MGRERYVVPRPVGTTDSRGKEPSGKVARARILLKADTGWGVMRIVDWTRLRVRCA